MCLVSMLTCVSSSIVGRLDAFEAFVSIPLYSAGIDKDMMSVGEVVALVLVLIVIMPETRPDAIHLRRIFEKLLVSRGTRST